INQVAAYGKKRDESAAAGNYLASHHRFQGSMHAMAQTKLGPILPHLLRLVASREAEERSDPQLLQTFARDNDPQAFAALVERHGRLVLNVCWHVLQHRQDAEDAFQATFLVLARKARSIRKQESLASWLHGVAYRMSIKAKRDAARRRAHESQAAE